MNVHLPSEFKPHSGKIFDAAKVTPQYVLRNGTLLVIRRVEKLPVAAQKNVSVWDALTGVSNLRVNIKPMPGLVEPVAL